MNWIYQNQFFILLGLLVVAAVILGWRLAYLQRRVRKLLGGSEATDASLVNDLIRRTTTAEIKLEELEPRLKLVEAISRMSVQKVGFLRFNPFSDTGGDNSFVVALLDRENNGVLLSSLYTREGVRVYAKNVEAGRSRHLLSAEEQQTLNQALTRSV